MKKIIFLLASAIVTINAQAGGLLTNTNHHISFARMLARGASTEIDAVYTNPAGTAWIKHEGWSLSLNNQSAFQTRNVLATFPSFPEENHQRKYKGTASAPVLPSAYAVYKKDRWALSGFFGITGGGGKCSFAHGLPMFDAAVMTGIYSQTAQLKAALSQNPELAPLLALPAVSQLLPMTPDSYGINSAMKGTQIVYGGQLGAAYRLNNHWSGYVGFRMNYFSGNYKGHVNVGLNPEVLATIQQIAALRPDLGATLAQMAPEGQLASIALDCDQTGWGVTPIVGIDYKWRGLTLAAKYEFKTNLNIENDTKQLDVTPATFEGAMADYQDGVNTPSDLPAILYVAAGYEFIPGKLRGTIEYHFFDDKRAEMAGDKQKALKRGTNEVLAGIEWDINKTFTVSTGFQRTDYGLADDFQTHTAFSCDSYSIGLGGAVNLSEKLRLNVGYFWTTYSDYTKNVEAGNPGYCNTTMAGTDVYSRTNKVFGVGVDYKF